MFPEWLPPARYQAYADEHTELAFVLLEPPTSAIEQMRKPKARRVGTCPMPHSKSVVKAEQEPGP